MPYDNIYWGQHCLRQWLFTWKQQAITYNSFDIWIVKFRGNNVRAIPQWMPNILYDEF